MDPLGIIVLWFGGMLVFILGSLRVATETRTVSRQLIFISEQIVELRKTIERALEKTEGT